MTQEDLLKEAERRYPIGTVYWNLNLAGERSEKHINAKPIMVTRKIVPYIERKDFQELGPVVALGNSQGFVYSGGKWAEIIVKIDQVINNYSIF